MIEVATLKDWLWLHSVRALPLPLPDHPRLQEAWIRSLYVPTTRDRDIAKVIGIVRARNGGTQRRWLGIDGVTDLGKTDLMVNFGIRASKFDQNKIPYQTNRRLHLPVLYVQATTKHDGLRLLRDICNFACLPEGGDAADLMKRLSHELPKLSTTLIVIDDAHMLRRTRRSATTLTDSLRVLLRLPVTFVYVGATLDDSALLQGGVGRGYESADQLRARAERFDLSPIRLPKDTGLYDDLIRKFAGKVAAGIPGMKFSGLLEPHTRLKLHEHSKGKHATIFCVLKDATMLAITSGKRDVSKSMLEQFWAQVPGQPHTINPDEWPDEIAVGHAG